VGSANYKHFFRTMVGITALLLLHGAVQLALLVDILVRDDGAKLRTEDWFGADATIPIVAVLVIFLLFDLAAFSLMSQLLAFHIKLQREGLTTYAFIVRDNQLRREKAKADNELETQRLVELEKAKQERRFLNFFQLQSAGWVSKTFGVEALWDPLRGKQHKDEELREGVSSAQAKRVEATNKFSPDRQEILQASTDMESFEAIRAISHDQGKQS
jgi:hypothetical protein